VPHLPGVEAMMAKDEASRGLGIELIDQGEGRAVTRMTVRDDMVNGHAIAHGGLSSPWRTLRSPARATASVR
jgi:acyl-coenzyme A thioesterase PaaI-like protein